MTPHQRKTTAIVSKLLEWYPRNARDLPWRRTSDPYAIWVSEVMLQQTQVKTVLGYWERWMAALPDIAALARAKPEKIHKLWEGLGYYTRVRNLQKAAQVIMAKHGGKFPERFEEVLDLPGIGRYTAGAICSIAFNQAKPILDGNVTRVLTRLFGIDGDPRKPQTNATLWQLAEQLVRHTAKLEATLTPSKHAPRLCSHLNQSLMELGALICTPRQPQCNLCPAAGLCIAHAQGRVQELPRFSPRVRATSRRFVAFVIRKRDRFLVRQRPAGVVNAHLWEFPNVETTKENSDLKRAARKFLGMKPAALEPLCTIKHTITRYRITMEVFHAKINHARPSRPATGQWLGRAELARLPFASAHKKILQKLKLGE